jgi:DUF1680 family protein
MNVWIRAALLGAVLGLSATAPPVRAQQNPAGLALPGTAKVEDVFVPVKPGDVKFIGGMLGQRFDAGEANRLLKIDENELLDGFEQRLKPHQDWAGEHVGKWLHAAVLTWADTHDKALKAKLDRVVARLIKTQEADGYLGTYAPSHRWTSWDVWVHKYDLLGLLTYYQYTGSKPALSACKRVGDLLVNTFGPGKRDINRAGEHMGMAADSVLEPICLLYRATADPRYLQFAHYIVSNYDAPGGPAILASLEKYRSVKRVANAKAYEMTSNFNGLLELYRITREYKLLSDMKIAWEDIVDNRLYLTGSASSYEVFQDDDQFPDGQKSNICETCVTVTWEQMNLQLLRLTGEAGFGDQLERSVYNHLLGAQKPTGDDWSYYTPMEGHKQYDSFITCCHSSGPRGIALLPEFAYMVCPINGAIAVNLYNSSHLSTLVPKVGRVTIEQTTNYPLDGEINLTISPERSGVTFPLVLRIPAGVGMGYTASVNGAPQRLTFVPKPEAGYCLLKRSWNKGDKVTLTLPMQPRVVMGNNNDAGHAAIVRGPLVLALDGELNPGIGALNRVALISDDVKKLGLRLEPEKSQPGAPVFSALVTVGSDPKPVRVYLAPFATAGEDGKSKYSVWMALPGHAAASVGTGSASLFSGAKSSTSREGNHEGDITDDDPDSYVVTFDGTKQTSDWYEVSRDTPVTIDRAVFMHGHCFHDGGWFDASTDKPRFEGKMEKGGQWMPIAEFIGYPSTTATNPANLKDGQSFDAHFAPIRVVAIRVVGAPACGDNPSQSFSSCAELQAFGTGK